MDQGTRLRQEFEARQLTEMTRAAVREARQRATAAFAGGVAGIVAVAVSAALTRHQIFWHSFVLEAVFGTAAGYTLARFHGGILKGALFFAVAYLASYHFRAAGMDPGILFAPSDLRLAVAGQGHLISLGMMLTFGGVLGHTMER